MATKKVLVAYATKGMNGSAYHRLHVPAMMLRHHGVEVTHVEDFLDMPERRLKEFCAVIVNGQLTGKAANPAQANPLFFFHEAARRVRESGIHVILDIDDMWNVGVSHPHYAMRTALHQRSAVVLSMMLSSAIWCSTEALLSAVQKLVTGETIFLVPNGISVHDKQWAKVGRTVSTDIRFGVVCNETHVPDLPRLREALRKMRKMPGWRIVAMGVSDDQRKVVAKELGTDRIEYRPWLPPSKYVQHFEHIDVLLCPLSHNEFNRYRSDLKLAECASAGIPVLCEPWGPYSGSRFVVKDWLRELPTFVLAPEKFAKMVPNPARFGTDESDRMRLKTLKMLEK